MEIIATKRLKDGLNFVIEYMEDGQLHCLFISAEKVVKHYKAAEQSVQRTGFACDVDGCKKPGVVHLCEDHGLQ